MRCNCAPAGLTIKWRDEMAEKFGLDLCVIDSEQCALVRREYGSAANPFEIYPLAIVSLPWLRMPKAQRLPAEVLPAGGPSLPRTFDLLILDEAHHVAPAAPKQVYAVDSQQTKLICGLAPHFTHRLFLSATPHNGYPVSNGDSSMSIFVHYAREPTAQLVALRMGNQHPVAGRPPVSDR